MKMIHKAKKSLGQNFLKSKQALHAMILAGEVNNKDVVVEIGPGKGALTEFLLEKAKKVIAVEKDRDLVEFLKEKFVKEIKSGKLKLLGEDILSLRFDEIFLNFFSGPRVGSPDHEKKLKTSPQNYKLIANIPYNITGAIFKKFLSGDIQPEKMVLLVQKEVCDRIVARDGKESILSISVKAYGEPKYILKVQKRFFSPEPKVDSAIIAISNISKNNFKNLAEENKFFEVLKTGFAHKRKVLIKNLEKLSSRTELEKIFENLKINKKARAETISVELWLEISKKLN